MTLVRLTLVGAMATLLALWAGDVFDQRVWSLLIAVIVPTLAMVGVRDRRWFVRVPVVVVSVVVATFAVAVVEDGGIGDVGVAATSGLRRILSTEWPSPVRPDLVATIALGLGVVSGLAAELARRPRLRLAPIAPIVVGAVAIIALSAPRGPAVVWPVAIGVLTVALAALGPDGAVRDRLRLLRGERRFVAILVVLGAVTTAVAIPLTVSGRADPRDTQDPERTSALLDPIEATLALQRIEDPIDLHRITVAEGDPRLPARWRTAALADYNGRRWTPDLAVRPIGRRLALDSEFDSTPLESTIEFLDDDLQLVPLPGRPVIVEAAIETDEARTIVRLVERPSPGTSIFTSALVEPVSSDELDEPIATREVDETASGLADLADVLADVDDGEVTSVLDRLRAIEQTMRNDFVLDPEASGGGLQRALIERFLRETQRGNAEQFSTAFVLLARSIGADARVATGFVVDPARVDGSVITLSSEDAAIWPEVRSGDQWLAFDPVPDVPLADEAPPPAEPTVQSPAAPQPPIAPPPDDIDEPLDLDEDASADVDGGVPTVVEFAVRAAAIGGLVLLPIIVALVLIIGAKWRRRRRRLRGEPRARIRGAWQEATDQLVDAGLTIAPAMTNDDIAHAGRPLAPAATRELDRLATLSTACTFGEPARPDLLADDASTCLSVVEQSVDLGQPLRARARRRLSLRSLRSTTRSPV